MKRVLVVEPDAEQRAAIAHWLETNGFSPLAVPDLCPEHDIDLTGTHVAIANTELPSGRGIALTGRLGGTPLILVADAGCIREAVESMRSGAADYLARPLDFEHLIAAIDLAVVGPGFHYGVASSAGGQQNQHMLGSCSGMLDLFERIRTVAPTGSPVLIQGESGTGKNLVARAIHANSQRAQAPLISLNCAAIPENAIEAELFGDQRGALTGANSSRSGVIEAAHGGTLFLDEIGELPLLAQGRLLRVLQENTVQRVGSTHACAVDVRLIAATHRDLERLTGAGRFREDLFNRLNAVTLRVLPLRERGEDVAELANAILTSICEKFNKSGLTFSSSSIQAMRNYRWPGNVRELENAVERAVILCESAIIEPGLLAIETPFRRSDPLPPPQDLDGMTSLADYFVNFVLEHQDQLTETELAQKLGISRKSLWERRQRLNIPRKRTRQRRPRRSQ
jgi:two-component system, NtrC family, response regulator HydG